MLSQNSNDLYSTYQAVRDKHSVICHLKILRLCHPYIYTVQHKSFSTGIPFVYHSKSITDPEAHSLVLEKGKYANIKDEILNTNCENLGSHKLYEQIWTKASEYIKTKRAKLPISKYKGWDGIMEMRNLPNNLLDYGDIMTIEHLICIITYCDYSKVCTKWSATFRPIHFGEPIESIKQRHMAFYNLSKHLYQLVHYFGAQCHGKTYQKKYLTYCDDEGPFFCGIDPVMCLPSFNIKLNSPTSTSRAKETALNFAGEAGMLIQFNNNGVQLNDRTAMFDASWISRYKEEEEVLFFNGYFNLRIEAITLIETCTKFELCNEALFVFDAMLNASDLEIMDYQNQDGIIYKKIDKRCKYILEKLIKIRLKQVEVQKTKMNPYIVETFDLFCDQREEIVLNNTIINNQYKVIENIIMYPLESKHTMSIVSHPNKSNYNLFKPVAFDLFPNLSEINLIMEQKKYGFSFKDLINLYSDLKNWKQSTKLHLKFKDWYCITPYWNHVLNLFDSTEFVATLDANTTDFCITIEKKEISDDISSMYPHSNSMDFTNAK